MEPINLKNEGIKLWGDDQTLRRWRQTLKHLRHFEIQGKDVLDIAGPSDFGQRLARRLDMKYYYTDGDLNFGNWTAGNRAYDVIFCFEVIEHLVNPLVFMQALKVDLYEEFYHRSMVFVTFPKIPCFLKGKNHWKEYTPREFYTLCELAGYEILDHQTFRNLNFKHLLTGIRPWFRLLLGILGFIKVNFYCLRPKCVMD